MPIPTFTFPEKALADVEISDGNCPVTEEAELSEVVDRIFNSWKIAIAGGLNA